MDLLDGMILRVDLIRSKISFESIKEYYPRFLGGRGINQYLLFKECPIDISPYDPANVIIFGAGLLAGTTTPGAVRLNIDSKNALTDGIGSSNVGGDFAPELRAAGISHILVTGKCKDLSYLWIDDGTIELRDATHLVGRPVSETETLIRKELGENIQILVIGPAGEHLVRSACIMVNQARAAGRCGLGAIMGSKNLKAIAVRGSQSIQVADENAFKEAINDIMKKVMASEFSQRRLKYGVYCYDAPWGEESPYRNFQGGVPNLDKTQNVYPEVFLQYRTSKKGCHGCPIQCWGVYEFEKKEDGSQVISEALQGNDLHDFGAKLDLCDAKVILEAHALSNDLGLDCDNVTGVLAWAFECYQRGLLTEEDTGGIPLEWGNAQVILDLLNKISKREGFGDLLAEGSKKAAEIIGRGTDRYAIHVKGQDLMECLWHSKSWALGTMVAARGGTHTRGAAIESRLQHLSREQSLQLFEIPSIGPMNSYTNKEKVVGFYERFEAVLDALGICFFFNSLTTDMLMPGDCASLLSAAIGESIQVPDLLQIGERIHTVEKAFNVLHAGWTRQADYPPWRFIEEPIIVDGEAQWIDKTKWDKLLDAYYIWHGWDPKTGWPTQKTLEALDLMEVANRLKEYGRLPQ
ncbi:MAG: aldehyde ferredoxin oxidoreductase family protein [Candidatus Heimdallarchaeota archaeon]